MLMLVMKKEKNTIEKAFGIWSNMKETGVVYADRMRKEWWKGN